MRTVIVILLAAVGSLVATSPAMADDDTVLVCDLRGGPGGPCVDSGTAPAAFTVTQCAEFLAPSAGYQQWRCVLLGPTPAPESLDQTVLVCETTYPEVCEDSGIAARSFDATTCLRFFPTWNLLGTPTVGSWRCYRPASSPPPVVDAPVDPAPGGDPAPAPPVPAPTLAPAPSPAANTASSPAPVKVSQPQFAGNMLRSRLPMSRTGAVRVTCRLRVVGAARTCRVTITAGGKRLGRSTASLRGDRASATLKLNRRGRGAVRRAGRRGLAVRTTIEVLNGDGERLVRTSRKTRLALR